MTGTKSQTNWDDIHIASPYDDSPDSEIASEDEIRTVANTGQVPSPQAIVPNMPIDPARLRFTGNDQVLYEAIQRAIDRGWAWQTRVNDATTIGMEAEAVLMEMKRKYGSARELLLDLDFARHYWGEGYEEHVKALAISPDVIGYLKNEV
jgi:hypothetical protein